MRHLVLVIDEPGAVAGQTDRGGPSVAGGSPRRLRFCAPFLAAGVLALAGCSGSTGQRVASPPPSCRALPASTIPEASGQLTEQNSGTYCLPVGKTVIVFLKVAPTATDTWAPISTSDPGVLEPQASGFLTLVRGVTGGYFLGAKAGVAMLSSTVGNRSWAVRVVVKTR